MYDNDIERCNFIYRHWSRCIIVFIFSFTLVYFPLSAQLNNENSSHTEQTLSVNNDNLHKEDESSFRTATYQETIDIFFENIIDKSTKLKDWEKISIIFSLLVVFFISLPTLKRLLWPFKFYSGLQGLFLGVTIGVSLSIKVPVTSLFLSIIPSQNIPLTIYYTLWVLLMFLFFRGFFIKNNVDTNCKDYLNYTSISKEIFSALFPANRSLEGRIITLYGINGIGKSYCLRLLARELKKEKKTIEYFYPSRYSNNIMQEEFFLMLENTITKKHFFPSLSFFSQSFSSLIQVAESNFRLTNIVQKVLNPLLFGVDKDVANVLRYYREETKDIVILIDEADRCSPEQLNTLMHLIRNLGMDFSLGIVITFTIEMEKQVKKYNSQLSHECLFEKVATSYFYMPKFSRDMIREYFKNCIELKCNIEDKEKELILITSLLNFTAERLLRTPRLVNIFYTHLERNRENCKLFLKRYHAEVFWITLIEVSKTNIFEKVKQDLFYIRNILIEKNADEYIRKTADDITRIICSTQESENVVKKFPNEYRETKKIVQFLSDIKESYWVEHLFESLIYYKYLDVEFLKNKNIYLNNIKKEYSKIIDKINIYSELKSLCLQLARVFEAGFADYPKNISYISYEISNGSDNEKKLLQFIFAEFQSKEAMSEIICGIHDIYEEKNSKDALKVFYSFLWAKPSFKDYINLGPNIDGLTLQAIFKILPNLVDLDLWIEVKYCLELDPLNNDNNSSIIKKSFENLYEQLSVEKNILYLLASKIMLSYTVTNSEELQKYLDTITPLFKGPLPNKYCNESEYYRKYMLELSKCFYDKIITSREDHKKILHFYENNIKTSTELRISLCRIIHILFASATERKNLLSFKRRYLDMLDMVSSKKTLSPKDPFDDIDYSKKAKELKDTIENFEE